MDKKTFQSFTGLYEISKTLRFELRPIRETNNFINEQKILQKDKLILENYNKIKKYFDKLHKDFIKEALTDANLDFSDYIKDYQLFIKIKKEKNIKEKNNLLKQEKKLRKEIVDLFNYKAKDWKKRYNDRGARIKKDNIDILFEKDIFDILKIKYNKNDYPDVEFENIDGKKENIFESFKGFTTYFTNFHNSRKNFYKDDGTASAIPTRIINENLRKFISNYEAYRHLKNIIKLNTNEKKIFELDYFNRCFLQKGIDEYNKVIGNINSKINQHRQEKNNKTPFLKVLFKQILEDVEKQDTEQDSFIEIENNKMVFEVLKEFMEHSNKNNNKFKEIFDLFISDNDYDLDKIYLAGRFVNQISNKWFKSWDLFGSLLVEKGKRKIADFIPFSKIKETLENIDVKNENLFKKEFFKKYKYKDLSAYDLFMEIWKDEFYSCLDNYNKTLKEVKRMIKEDKEFTNKKEKRNTELIEVQKEKIKKYADSALSIFQMMKYFLLQQGKQKVIFNEIEAKFYNNYDSVIEEAKTWLYYNEFRNFLTRKPFNEEKIKLNFNNGTLLDGWDKNKESDNYGLIFKKDNKYFLGLMTKKSNKIFSDKVLEEVSKSLEDGFYEKMVYKFLPDPKKMLPKVCFSKKGVDFFKPNKELLRIKEKEEFKINTENFSFNSLHKIIDYYKDCLKKYEDWKCFDFRNLKNTKDYKSNIGEFYKDIEKNSWKVWFEKISEKYINEKVEKGELYLFEIYNKDFSDKSSGRKNLHTIYFENIFSKENIENPVIKLNGQAEIFFREKTENLENEKIITKKKKIEIKKNNKNIIHKKRYTENKILFHCPIKLNFSKNNTRINFRVNEYLANNKDIKIIGIDRGEKHLAYYSIIDEKGNIMEMDSLNNVNGINYLKLLHKKEKNIDKQQESWQAIENIKELKEGYISQMVKKICDLSIKYNAIIIFEDLNSGFKRGRQKIRKQIYQKLELALVNKLNYLVYKDKKNKKEAGHYLNAFQLSPKIQNFKDIGKQTGIIFYTQASYTSTTCPKCGFRKNLYLKYKNIKESKEYLENLEIYFDNGKYELEYNPANFKDINFPIKKYKVVIKGERIRWDNINKKNSYFDLEDMVNDLFLKYKIDQNKNISDQIRSREYDSNFYKSLFFIINLALQLRNSDSEKEIDYLICPACGFHSKDGFQNNIYNADANGAYNIARKGIMILNKIKEFKKKNNSLEKLKWSDLIIKNEEWDEFTQK